MGLRRWQVLVECLDWIHVVLSERFRCVHSEYDGHEEHGTYSVVNLKMYRSPRNALCEYVETCPYS